MLAAWLPPADVLEPHDDGEKSKSSPGSALLLKTVGAGGGPERGGFGDAGRLPRRSRCTSVSGCGATHVLLPASVLLCRADAVGVIGAGLLAAAGGLGHRRVAGVVGRPARRTGAPAPARRRSQKLVSAL